VRSRGERETGWTTRSVLTLSHPVLQITERAMGIIKNYEHRKNTVADTHVKTLIVPRSHPASRIIIQIRFAARGLSRVARRSVMCVPTWCPQSVRPFKVLWILRQPLVPRQMPDSTVDHTTDLWQVRPLLPIRAMGQYACLHGPVNLYATPHHLMIDLSTLSTVPADSEHN
jgi:hypothetical protein